MATVKCASVNSILSNVLTSSDLGLLHRKNHLFAIIPLQIERIEEKELYIWRSLRAGVDSWTAW